MAFEFWDEFVSDIMGYWIDGFSNTDPYLFPFLFIGIIGFIYASLNSITVAIVGILLTIGLFGSSFFAGIPDLTNLLYIVTILGISLLIVTLFIKRR